MAVASLFEELLDQYKIEQRLAEKRHTDLCRAYDVDEDRLVRLDIVRPGPAEDNAFAGRFVNRARAVTQLRHPNIAPIYHIGKTADGHPYVAQAYVDGIPLSQRLDELARRETQVNALYALKLVRQLADALVLSLIHISTISGDRYLVLDYAPDANGKSDVIVRATDSAGLSVQTTFKVTVNAVNDLPTTNGIADVNVDEDAPNTVINLMAAFADKEDADLEMTYTVTANSNAGLFDGVTINVTDSSATLTLDYKANTSGTANLTVQAKDTDNGTVSTSFTVTLSLIHI